MGAFREALDDRSADPEGRTWVFVPYDQLTDRIGPLASLGPERAGIVLVESPWKAARRPYHRRKLALVLANQRHFALEQAERGVAVRHVVARGPYRAALAPLARELGPLVCMRPAERELRADLQPLVDTGALELRPHEGWLTEPADLERAHPRGAPWRMDRFYREVRQRTGVLMDERGKPVGGKYSFDADNRGTWSGAPPAPALPTFQPDAVTREVLELVEREFAHHPGEIDADTLPATRDDARALWTWARRECLEHFGPFQDAMSTRANNLFHTRIAPLLHLHRLLPREVVDDVLDMDLPLQSAEGFIRQVLGWREFVHQVHEATDGLRTSTGMDGAIARSPGDGGWSRWSGRAWESSEAVEGLDGGAAPSALDTTAELPPAFWGSESGLRCLDHEVATVWSTGSGHHITRLMVLANLGTLLGISPRELTDWFWVAYDDAYDWVVEPNVLGMGTFAVGELMTTKPYVSGAAYIDRMGDHCGDCAFHPKRNCPVTRLYWAFLDRNAGALEGNQRVAMPLRSLERRAPQQRELDRRVFEHVHARLAAGERLEPGDLPT
ncbi:cryptochrome/photolyase family protein [Engelhardtia mirabilis]|uniref:Deoxyribodipyrimidine photo-lyase-related protein n=1 Tax=Engelhardtia mirabilis TaxID=2528011 RepID=A0A518BHD7_9BACT|nr:Deoxyribodipyrimidine photo-lyase-related protein [Planctomycetes bacterium Pla133]QDV00725.1 Deoxyribodipyrimidine photo-lyase-related protein [Planctomycetes bacterium Pla86]